jgi:hypothetical protein
MIFLARTYFFVVHLKPENWDREKGMAQIFDLQPGLSTCPYCVVFSARLLPADCLVSAVTPASM